MTTLAAPAPWRMQDGLRYGLLGLPLAFCALPLYVLMPHLYAQERHVSLAALGAVLLGVRLLDALIDPLLGRLCDRWFAQSLSTVLHRGAWAAVALAWGFACLFMPPDLAPDTLLWWAAGSLAWTYTAFSALTLAHQSWGAMLGGDAVYRSRVVAWREGLGVVGVLLATLTPAIGGSPVMVGLLVLALSAGFWAWCQSPRPSLIQAAPNRPVGRHHALWHAWRNRAFRQLLGVYLLNGIASAIPATLVMFFIQDRLQASGTVQSVALGLYFGCAALSLPLWLRLVTHRGLERSWLLGMVSSVVVFLGASLLGAGDALWFMLVCALSGAALGSDLAVPGALLAGVVARSGEGGQSEGAYFGWWNFATKLNLALAAGLALPLLGALGYAPGTRDPDALAWLSAAYCLLPCLLKTMAAAALQRFLIPPREATRPS